MDMTNYPADGDYTPEAFRKRVEHVKALINSAHKATQDGTVEEQYDAYRRGHYGESLLLTAFIAGVAQGKFEDPAAVAEEILEMPSIKAAGIVATLFAREPERKKVANGGN